MLCLEMKYVKSIKENIKENNLKLQYEIEQYPNLQFY